MKRLTLLFTLLFAASAQAVPIPGPLSGPLPRYTGAPVAAQPLFGPWNPANPALAADGRSGSGLAAGNGAASPFAGPLGKGTTSSSTVNLGTCASLAFAADGRLLALCNGVLAPSLLLVDPATLASVATLSLPVRPSADRTDTAGGTHFIVRADGTLAVPTNDGKLATVVVDPGGLHIASSLDLKAGLGAHERPFAVAAGYDGNDWVAGNQGTILAIPRAGGAPQALPLHEPIGEDMATDATGTYVVTTKALYRLRADAAGKPRVVWRQALSAAFADKGSGKLHPGSGTPPAIVARRYVAVADALDPSHVDVMRLTGGDAHRLFCSVPVFNAGASAVESQLVVAGHSIVVANSYGYTSPFVTEAGKTTAGGLARVVVSKRGCRIAWTSADISPSAQMVVSRATGLLYTTEKPKGFPDAWNLAALDWRTGARRFTALAGEGLGYNSDGGAVVLGPDGAAYAGSFGGLTRFADAP